VLCTTGCRINKSVDVGTTEMRHLKSVHVVFVPCYQYCKYGGGASFRDLDRPTSPIYTILRFRRIIYNFFSRKLSEPEDGRYRPKHVVFPC